MQADAVIVGLGNPGPRYAFTRHNAGFIALDIWAQNHDVSFSGSGALAKKTQAEVVEIVDDGKKLLLLKPQTFMNLSGESLRALYEKEPQLREKPLIVFHDEADIPFGQLRVKFGGGDAGQNGLKSIRACLGHGEYFRIRMGIGKPVSGSNIDLATHVLMPFRKDDEAILLSLIDRSLAVAKCVLKDGLPKAQEMAARFD